MQGPWRRVTYVALYELFAVAATSFGLAALTGESAAHSSVIATVTAAIAVAWNVIWNSLFERWEARQARRGRSLWRRIAHALGMEGGLVLMLVPLFAWWFGVGLWQAFIMDLWLLLYFLVYTFVFNWTFDRIFGLPASAQRQAVQVAA
ncbi:MAG: PACE efflux transporter [Janthinobacterium sp.]